MLATAVNATRLCVDYCRISFDKRGEAEGVDSQHYQNERSAEEIGMTISASYVDNDVSAFSGVERPEYQRLLADMKAGKVGFIIVRHADRLLRSVEEAMEFIPIARAQKVLVYSGMKGSFYNLNKAQGRRDFTRDTVDSQYESAHRGERVTDARNRQARHGTYGGGVRPYGWGVDTGRVRSTCVNPSAPVSERLWEDRPVLDMSQHNEEEAREIRKWVAEIFAGVKLAHILRDLAERDVKTVSQKDGRTLRRGGKEVKPLGWSNRTIVQILTHPRVSGHSVHQGEIVKKNAFKAIIPEDQRQALITLFGDPRRKTSPGNTPKWLGSLIYDCGLCDDGSKSTVRNNGSGVPVYTCRTKGHVLTPAVETDKYIAKVLKKRLSRDDIADLLPEQSNVDHAALRDELIALEAAKKTAARKFALRTWDEETADEVIAAADERMNEIRNDLKSASNGSPLAEFVASDDAAKTWKDSTLGRKREILKELLTVRLLPVGRLREFDIAEYVEVTPI